jgi:hypothetical protein
VSFPVENDLHLHPGFGSLGIEIDEELGMFTSRPPHGYSPQQLSELGTAELFVLSSLRLWFLSHCDRENSYPDWRQAFETARIGKMGTWGFDRLCRIVGTTTVRSLDVHWLHCVKIGAYESSLLMALGYLQNNQLGAAEVTLLEWCPPTAVRLALEAGQALATALELHGLLIPIREHESLPPRAPSIPVPSSSALLH